MITRLKQKWTAAKSEPERGQLTHREWRVRSAAGVYLRHWIEHGWWLTPDQFAIGITVDRVDWLPCRAGLTLQLGCLLWTIDINQPMARRVRTAVTR